MSRMYTRNKAKKRGRGIVWHSAVTFLAICLLLAVPEFTLGQSSCSAGWHFVQTKCFTCFLNITIIPVARMHCTSIGGTLASLHNSAEEQWIINNCGTRVFIGFNSAQHGWEDGSAVNYTNNLGQYASSDDCVVARGTRWWNTNCTHMVPNYPATAACSYYPGAATVPQTSARQTTASPEGSTGVTAGAVTDPMTSTQQTTAPQTRAATKLRTTARHITSSPEGSTGGTAEPVTDALTSTQQTLSATPRCDIAVSARQRSTYNAGRAVNAIDGLSDTCSVTGHAFKNWLKVELRCRATVSRITLEGTGLHNVHVTVGDGTEERGYRGGGDLPANHLCAKDHNPPFRGKKQVTCYSPVHGKYIYIYSAAGNTHALSICNLKVNG